MRSSELRAIEVELFIEALKQRHDYDFSQYARASLRRRVQSLADASGVEYISEMIPRVLYDDNFLHEVLSYLSIQVSEFFRDPDVYKQLRENVLPILKTYPEINIWTAGCANGEEAYSLAIMLKEEGLFDRAHIYATDIHSSALRKAKEGIYSKEQFELYEKNYQASGGKAELSHYFQSGYDHMQIDPSLKEIIFFSEHNLTIDSVFCEANLIMCRNVLIYFKPQLQSRALELFYDTLVRSGFLCLGNKESIMLTSQQNNFTALALDQRIYQKNKTSQ